MDTIIIYYDQQCPFCRKYSTYLQLQDVADLTLRNAREYPQKMQAYDQQGYDINQGMIVVHNNDIYHGANAILYIQYLTTKNNLYRYRIVKKLRPYIYYCINKIRQAILWIKKAGPIK